MRPIVYNKSNMMRKGSAQGMKLFFFDLDGTLMANDSISDRNLDALHRLRAAGHKLFINSGRSCGTVPARVKTMFPWDGMICGSAYVTLDGALLAHEVIPHDTLPLIMAYCRSSGTDVNLEGENDLYFWRCDGHRGLTFDEVLANGDALRLTKATLLKPVERPHWNDFPGMHVIDMGTYSELICNGYNKSTGMALIGERLGVGREDMVAFGDSPNDTEMLAYAGCAVVMAHAPHELDAYADLRTSPGPDGVAEGIRTLFPALFDDPAAQ